MGALRLLWLLALLGATAQAQTPPAVAAARQWRQANERAILVEFLDLLRIPNVASDHANIGRNAALIRTMLEKRGVSTRLLEAPGAPPVVYGEIRVPGAARTVLIYAHYDGQPVDARDWTGSGPFEPVLRNAPLERDGAIIPLPPPGAPIDPEWRLYGRSTSDDKAPIVAVTAALDALRARGLRPASNIKFFFEGEEEAGSRHVERILRDNAALVASDVWLICDGPVHQTRRQQVYFGARGVTGLGLTVYGPRRELHSGHYGNWAPNPAMMLARLLASMKDDGGRVLVEGFYDNVEPLGEIERRALAEAPHNDADLRRELWMGASEGGGRNLAELITVPALNVRGLASVHTGNQSRNVVPASATASIDIRLVKGQDHRAEVERLINHIRRQGFHVVEAEPDAATRLRYPKIARVNSEGGYNAFRTPMDLPVSRQVIRAVESARGPVVALPTLGGSVPLVIFHDVLRVPMIGVPIANHDNSQHSANENIRLQNLWDGIETMAALLTMP